LIAAPYDEKNFVVLSDMERGLITIHISNTFSALIWHLNQYQSSEELNWLIFFYFAFSNFTFIFWWFNKYFGFLKNRLAKIRLKRKWLDIFIDNKRNSISQNKNSKNISFLNEKIVKLKLLNSLLIEKINQLERNEIDESIPEEVLKPEKTGEKKHFDKNQTEIQENQIKTEIDDQKSLLLTIKYDDEKEKNKRTSITKNIPFVNFINQRNSFINNNASVEKNLDCSFSEKILVGFNFSKQYLLFIFHLNRGIIMKNTSHMIGKRLFCNFYIIYF
jgi:hypothetical protein